MPTIAADRQLPGNATGTVTENWMAGELRSGSRAYQVNDRTVVALHTATPLYATQVATAARMCARSTTNCHGSDTTACRNPVNTTGTPAMAGASSWWTPEIRMALAKTT